MHGQGPEGTAGSRAFCQSLGNQVRPIGRSVIHDDDLGNQTAWNVPYDERKRVSFVEDRDDHRRPQATSSAASRGLATDTARPARMRTPAATVRNVRLSFRTRIASADASRGWRKT